MNPWIPRKESLIFLKDLEKQTFADTAALREKLAPLLKEFQNQERTKAEANLLENRNGLVCAKALSATIDVVIRTIFDALILKLSFSNPEFAPQSLCVVATGGYGRATLAPSSDIDLLFLLSSEHRALGEQIAQGIVYILWDLKLKVGHSVRSVDESLQDSVDDFDTRTALLEARPLIGNLELFKVMEQRFHNDIVKQSVAQFVDKKLQERDKRIEKAGESRYLLEPNIKEGKGGLRDLHTLTWIFRYVAIASQTPFERVKSNLVPLREAKLFARSEEFLWRLRCHMHFITGRAEEHLTFDVQQQVATRLGYADRSNLSAVERFMKSYYLAAKDVGVLTAYLCAALEARHVKTIPSLNRSGKALVSKRSFLNDPYFVRENGRLTIKREDAFTTHPINIIRMFWLADRYHIPLHPDALYQARQARKLLDRPLRQSAEANQIFLDILMSRSSPERILRMMNDADVLGQFIPEFGRIVGMMQFNMYHSFTIDEHLLRSVGALTALEAGSVPETERIVLSLSVENRRELFVATLLHDIGKGRSGDHSDIGAVLAKKLGSRLGLNVAETDTVSWLIAHHLLMSNTAQRRDLTDPLTIKTFADIVQSRERLKLLYLLTIADIKAVGAHVWTPWKGQLLHTLYHEAELVLGGQKAEGFQARIRHKQEKLRLALADWPEEQWAQLVRYHDPGYWIKVETAKQKEHAVLIVDFETREDVLASLIDPDMTHDTTEITVYAPNRSHLLSIVAGACAASDANIIEAQVFTTSHGFGLSVINLARAFEDKEDEMRRGQRIVSTIKKALANEATLAPLIHAKKQKKNKLKAFKVPSRVAIDNTSSFNHTMIEVTGLDRPGLLYELTKTIAQFHLVIHSAHIATFGEKVADTFYVTTEHNLQCVDNGQQQRLRQSISAVLEN